MKPQNIYYYLKPFIPRPLQILLRRNIILNKLKRFSKVWPIDPEARHAPKDWTGWPHGKRFAFILTHDVDTMRGHEQCKQLMNMEKCLGFRSSFNIVPRRYVVSPQLIYELKKDSFEVGVHGLYHDGKLYNSRALFNERAIHINTYLKTWGAVGFRSPAMHHRLDWLFDLNILYDASTFDTDPFEPQPDGVRTIFPFWVESVSYQKGYVELPYTLPQDFTLFVLMKEESIDIWKRKLDWIVENGGMVLLNCHPDYMNFKDGCMVKEGYPSGFYQEFLEYVKQRYDGLYWHVLPKEIASFWESNFKRNK
jgi:hypothetical protein